MSEDDGELNAVKSFLKVVKELVDFVTVPYVLSDGLLYGKSYVGGRDALLISSLIKVWNAQFFKYGYQSLEDESLQNF